MKILIFLFLWVPFASIAQQGYYIGIGANTGFYQLYNYNDFHADPLTSIPIKWELKNFYDYKAGLKIGYKISDRNWLDAEITYDHYRQDYKADRSSGSGEVWYYHTSKLSYLSFAPGYIINFINKRSAELKPNFYVRCGFHISYLLNYNENGYDDSKLASYRYNNDNGNIINSITYSTGQVHIDYSTTESIYSQFIWGVNLSFGYKAILSDNLDLGFEINSSYDISNVDNLDAVLTNEQAGYSGLFWQNNSKLPGSRMDERKASHNIYAGIGFNLIYHLGNRNF